MIIANRFIEIAEEYHDHEIPIDRVFEGADLKERDSIVEAMYVIASRRASSGKPVAISEITDGIPNLVEDKGVLDAAIDICLDGLISSGHSQESAYSVLLQSTASVVKKNRIQESVDIASFIEHSVSKSLPPVRRLPADFGSGDFEGRKRYELRRILGSGSQGTMYEAVDRMFAEDGHPSLVAVKIAHDDLDADRSILEGSRASRVRHKNVAHVKDCGRSDENESYVTYELIDGLSLDSWIKQRQGPLSPTEACEIIVKLANGVQCAHNSGVIHRDLKPSNILMTRDHEPMITDFGIAHTATSDPRLCSYYGTRGSLAFMAPEQFHGSSDSVMPSVDTYALGGLLYWLLTGRFPNGETVSDALLRLDLHNEGKAERVFDSHIDRRLVSIVERALAVDLGDRYNSAASLANDLDAYLNRLPIPWLDRSWVVKTELFARRNPLMVVLNFVVMGVIGIAVAIWMSSQAQIQLEQSQSQAALEVQRSQSESELEQEKLNTQIKLEQNRVQQLQQKNQMAKLMINAWRQSINSSNDIDDASSNLLFLYTVSTCGFLDDDPDLANKILNTRIVVAEDYLASLTPDGSSPIQRAQWHEMLGVWYADQADPKGVEHLKTAAELVKEYVPSDTHWRAKLDRLQAEAASPSNQE